MSRSFYPREHFSSMHGSCAYCLKVGTLKMSHAIPSAAFKPMLTTGQGQAIGIPYGTANVHLTSDTGDAPLLCAGCEKTFNRNFDAPMINALKSLENQILANGFGTSVQFGANQMAHAVVSIAWRVCLSPAHLYSEVVLTPRHLAELDRLLRSPTKTILRDCTVRLGRLADNTPETSGGFGQKLMRQFVKTPQIYSVKSKGKLDGFAMDWTMFGFLVHLVVPRLPYAKRQNFRGLRRDSSRIRAMRVNMFDYRPLVDALVAGYAAEQEGRLSPTLKARDARSPSDDGLLRK